MPITAPGTDGSQAVQVVESISVMEVAKNDADWQKAYEKGLQLVQDNDLKKATFYFTNSLAKNPGNMQVISAYVDVLMKLAAVAKPESDAAQDVRGIQAAYEYLNIAEVFLQGQIANGF